MPGTEKAHHLTAGAGALAVGVAAARVAARPGVAGAVHDPVLGIDAAVRAPEHGARVGVAPRHAARFDRHRFARMAPAPLDEFVTVDRVHGGVAVAVEYDHRHGAPGLRAPF